MARLRAAGCVFAEDEAALIVEAAASPDELEAMVVRRGSGLPLEQVLGWAEFCGLRIVVEPGVFVPRRRTALLVEQTIALLDGVREPVVVDLCCGTGAVAVAVHHARRPTSSCTRPTSSPVPSTAPGATSTASAPSTRAT